MFEFLEYPLPTPNHFVPMSRSHVTTENGIKCYQHCTTFYSALYLPDQNKMCWLSWCCVFLCLHLLARPGGISAALRINQMIEKLAGWINYFLCIVCSRYWETLLKRINPVAFENLAETCAPDELSPNTSLQLLALCVCRFIWNSNRRETRR